MTTRNMIMPIAPERDDQASLVRALDVATALNCHLDVVFVRPDPNETYFYTGFTPQERDHVVADMQKHMEQRGRSAAEKSRRKFNALRKEAGVAKGNRPDPAEKPTAAWRQVKGETFTILPGLAHSADIAFFTPKTAEYRLISQNVLETTLLSSGRPVLYAPKKQDDSPWSRVLIAWDGSASCARAISAWLASGMPLRSAVILHVTNFHEDAPSSKVIETQLAWHGLTVEIYEPEQNLEPVGKVIADCATRLGCGLIVMGGYCHLRTWEATFGGVTRYMIRHATHTVLMMH